ncbi:MFS transporter [Fictibacillus barbaricus]|uniref:MFS family permease n=1 Tax=Fictibacillus barbaricus TaxID=182136 RepID=A0ABU1U3U0_9BACL|nr:MFS transporter [Fictibacillus barbaricus]MDR7074112.1 MFS family permease [Fictibacillus barbaricus]
MEHASEKLLKSKPYQYLISAQLISNLGDWLSILAVFTLVGLKWEATPLQISFIMLSLALPMTILGPISGVFADRWERKYIMIVADAARSVIIFGLVFATELWHIYALLIGLGLFSTVFNPAKNGKLKEIVPDHHMQQATSVSSVIENGTKIIGPALSGFLLTLWSFNIIFILDALSFLLSALLLLNIPTNTSRTMNNEMTTERTENNFVKELLEGFTFIKSLPIIFYGTLLMAITMFVIQMSDSQFVTLFRELEDSSPKILGTVMTASGAGFLVSGLILSKYEIKKAINAMAAGIFVLGLGFFSLALLTDMNLAAPMIWAPAVTFLACIGAGLVFIPFQSNVMKETPSDMSGRTLGTIGSVMMFASLIGPLAGGVLANIFGVIPIFICTSSGLCLISVLAFILRAQFEAKKGEPYVTESNGESQRRAEA